MDDKTTIQLEKEILEKLKKAKKYRRETYCDQIERMLEKGKKLK